MTVAELLRELRKFDLDTEVVIDQKARIGLAWVCSDVLRISILKESGPAKHLSTHADEGKDLQKVVIIM